MTTLSDDLPVPVTNTARIFVPVPLDLELLRSRMTTRAKRELIYSLSVFLTSSNRPSEQLDDMILDLRILPIRRMAGLIDVLPIHNHFWRSR